MKLAFTSKGQTWNDEMDPRFGRAEFILIYDDDQDNLEVVNNSDIAAMAHGAGPKAAQRLFELKPNILITGNGPGGNAAQVFEKTDIEIFIGAGSMTVKEAYEAYKKGSLKKM